MNFKTITKSDFEKFSDELFDILHSNMEKIAPTGESYEDDKQMWVSSIKDALENPDRHIIIIENDNETVGFFMYSISNDLLKMEEIQFKEKHQGKGVFKELYHFLFTLIPDNITYVEAFANKSNIKSQGILIHLKLERAGENHNGRCYRYYGLFSNMKNVIG